MKTKYTLIFIFLISFNFLNAQITDFITGIDSRNILIDGDYLFYISNSEHTIYRTDISDLAFPTILPLFTEDPESEKNMHCLAKNGNDLYYGSSNPVTIYAGLRKIDLSDLGAGVTELVINTSFHDLVFNSNTIYSTGTYYYVDTTNILLTPPITPTIYESDVGSARCLHNDGFTLYIGTLIGNIYTKNLLIDAPSSLLYTSA